MDVNIPDSRHPRIVVVGGGFGGLAIARILKNKPVQVVLLDKNNYHTFQPLLYQVATAGLEPDSIAFPLRKIFKKYNNLIFRMAEVIEIHPTQQSVSTTIGDISYDYLVLATGSRTNFFGNEMFSTHTVPMKSVIEALDFRSLLFKQFEKALLTSDLKKREALMTIAVVGGGPTGVETAGALAELKRHVLPNDYPELDIRRMQIHLIEAAPRLLGGMSDHAGKKAQKALEDLDVHVWLNSPVKSYDGTTLMVGEKSLQTETVMWSAGVEGATIPGIEKAEIVRGNRIQVDEMNLIPPFTNVFAIGDLAYFPTNEFPKGLPMVAPVAIQQGEHLAKNLLRQWKQKAMVPFSYHDKGSMATVGRNRAVVDLGPVKFSGWLAWFVWMAVHLMTLVGFRNKLVVFINWFWNYISYDRGTRLIIRK